MEVYVIEDYKGIYPDLESRRMTEALVEDLLRENGYVPEGEAVRIRRLEGGKPVLETHPRIHFSVSHTGTTFACAIGDRPVGLDLQEGRDMKVQRLADRYFTREEILAVREGGRGAFFRLWTRKEAYSKYTGEGLAAVLRGEPVLGREDVDFTDLVLGDGLYACLCTGK